MRRVAVVASHPIQYQAPWFRALARACDLTVFFCHRPSAADQARAGFDQPFEWDVPLLDGYAHVWLRNRSRRPGVDRFGGCDTPEIGAQLAGGRFEACVVSGWYLKSYLQAMRACRRIGLPVIVRGDSHALGGRRGVRSAITRLPRRWLLRAADAHVYVGRANRAYLRAHGVPDARLFFAPHGVDDDRFAGAARQAGHTGTAQRLREAWGAGPDTTIFLFAGKLRAGKRAADVVAAVARLADRRRDVRGVIVGSGPEEAALRRQAAAVGAPVIFDGFRNQSEMPVRYAAADCLVVPSARESWGLVVNEAMAAGRPAIVTDRVGCGPDLVENGRTGFTYPVGDVSALASRMEAIRSWRGQAEVATAVQARLAGYSCAAAVDGTLRAVEAVTRSRVRGDVTAPERVHHA